MLGSDDIAALKATLQRYRLYCVSLGTFQGRSFTTVGQLSTVSHLGEDDWKPVLNVGPHRLAFVGEEISFDALRSYLRGEGAGAGSVTGGTWTFGGGTASGTTGTGPHTVSWSTPGLKTVTYTNDGTVATRRVRVLADRETTQWDIVAIGSLSGNTGEGWTGNLVVAPSDDTGADASDIADFQRIGIFCEDLWGEDEDPRDLGGISGDPRCVMIGYVTQGSIARDHQSHTVSFDLETVNYQMRNTQVHKTATWFGSNPSTFGVVFDDISRMTITDVALWLLQFKTNFLDEHDFDTFWNSKLQALDSVEGEESSVQSVLSSWAQASYCLLYDGADGTIKFAPTREETEDADWTNTAYPTVMRFDAELLFKAELTQDKQRNVIYVQLLAQDTRHARQVMGEYPDPSLDLDGPPSGAGSWVIRKDLLGSNQSWITQLAEDVYAISNRKWAGNLMMGLNRAVHPGDEILLTLELTDSATSWTNKKFLVDQVTYEVDPGIGTWKTTLHVYEEVT